MWSRRDAAGARPVPLASVMAVQATAGPPHRSPIADSAQISPKVRCRVPTADGRQPPKTATRASRRLRATGSSKWTALHRTTHSRGSACQNLYKPLPRQPSRLAPAFLRAGRVDHHQAHILSAATTPVLPHRSARYVCCRRPRSPASHRTDPGWPPRREQSVSLPGHGCRSANPSRQFCAQYWSRAKEPPSVPIGGYPLRANTATALRPLGHHAVRGAGDGCG